MLALMQGRITPHDASSTQHLHFQSGRTLLLDIASQLLPTSHLSNTTVFEMDWKHHMPATEAIEIGPGRPSKHEASPTTHSSSFLPELKKTKVEEDDAIDDGSTGALILSSRSASLFEVPGDIESEVDEAEALEMQILSEQERARLQKLELYRQWRVERARMKAVTVNGRQYLLATYGSWHHCLLDAIPRPISEPPIFDYDWMTKEKGWIEKEEEWHDMKYGEEISFKTQRIDLVIEQEVVTGYRDWRSEASDALFTYLASRSISESDAESRERFMDRLEVNLTLDLEELKLELFDLEGTKEAHPVIAQAFPRWPEQRERLVRNVAAWKAIVENWR